MTLKWKWGGKAGRDGDRSTIERTREEERASCADGDDDGVANGSG